VADPVAIAAVSTVTPRFPNTVIEMPNFSTDSGVSAANVGGPTFRDSITAAAYEEAGMRAMLGIPILDFPTPYAADADGYLQRGLAARDAFKHAPRLSFSLAPHAPYTVADATWREVVTYARQLDLVIQTHVAETRQEVDDARAAFHETPLAFNRSKIVGRSPKPSGGIEFS